MTRAEARVLAIMLALTPLAIFTAVLILAAVFVWWAANYHGPIPGDIGVWIFSIFLVKYWPLIALAWLLVAAFTAAGVRAITRS